MRPTHHNPWKEEEEWLHKLLIRAVLRPGGGCQGRSPASRRGLFPSPQGALIAKSPRRFATSCPLSNLERDEGKWLRRRGAAQGFLLDGGVKLVTGKVCQCGALPRNLLPRLAFQVFFPLLPSYSLWTTQVGLVLLAGPHLLLGCLLHSRRGEESGDMTDEDSVHTTPTSPTDLVQLHPFFTAVVVL